VNPRLCLSLAINIHCPGNFYLLTNSTFHSIYSDGFFALETLPKKVAIIGSGYIGVEIAGVLKSLGSDGNA
jgi:hypothetical protein